MRTFAGLDDLTAEVGQELGTGGPIEVTQDVIDAFAEATGDFQFIHVEPEKAAQTPFGGTIAHGLYTLSVGPRLMSDIWTLDGVAMAVNYGYGKVRFPAPVPVGSKLSMSATLASVDDVAGGAQLTVTQTFTVEGGEKPVCVAEALVRVFTGG